MALLCGDMNVDSTDSTQKMLIELKKDMGQLAPFQEKVFQQAENEYKTMLFILSNLGTEEIQDCLEDNLDNNEIKVTYGNQDENGEAMETTLTGKEEQCIHQRLDYVLWLNKGNKNCENKAEWNSDIYVPQEYKNTSKLEVDISQTFIEPHFTPKNDECVYDHPWTQISDHYGIKTVLKI